MAKEPRPKGYPKLKNYKPLHIIKAASEGDVLAINTVLKHYEGYKS